MFTRLIGRIVDPGKRVIRGAGAATRNLHDANSAGGAYGKQCAQAIEAYGRLTRHSAGCTNTASPTWSCVCESTGIAWS
jgi:hypothetical protein